jgi:hypothetical protein
MELIQLIQQYESQNQFKVTTKYVRIICPNKNSNEVFTVVISQS